MANSSAIYARIDSNLKKQAESILSQLGITPSALIQMTYSQVVLNKGLPFAVRLPYSEPTSIGNMTVEELRAEINKGADSLKTGRISVDELDREFKEEFGV